MGGRRAARVLLISSSDQGTYSTDVVRACTLCFPNTQAVLRILAALFRAARAVSQPAHAMEERAESVGSPRQTKYTKSPPYFGTVRFKLRVRTRSDMSASADSDAV